MPASTAVGDIINITPSGQCRSQLGVCAGSAGISVNDRLTIDTDTGTAVRVTCDTVSVSVFVSASVLNDREGDTCV